MELNSVLNRVEEENRELKESLEVKELEQAKRIDSLHIKYKHQSRIIRRQTASRNLKFLQDEFHKLMRKMEMVKLMIVKKCEVQLKKVDHQYEKLRLNKDLLSQDNSKQKLKQLILSINPKIRTIRSTMGLNEMIELAMKEYSKVEKNLKQVNELHKTIEELKANSLSEDNKAINFEDKQLRNLEEVSKEQANKLKKINEAVRKLYSTVSSHQLDKEDTIEVIEELKELLVKRGDEGVAEALLDKTLELEKKIDELSEQNEKYKTDIDSAIKTILETLSFISSIPNENKTLQALCLQLKEEVKKIAEDNNFE
jgi:hypothetical protein